MASRLRACIRESDCTGTYSWVRTGGWWLFRWALGPASDGGSGQWELGALVGVTTVLSDPLVGGTAARARAAVYPSPLRMVELCL